MTAPTTRLYHVFNGGPYYMGGQDELDSCEGHDSDDLKGIVTCKDRAKYDTTGLPALEFRLDATVELYKQELTNV